MGAGKIVDDWNEALRDITTVLSLLTGALLAVIFTGAADNTRVWYVAYPEIHPIVTPLLEIFGSVLVASFSLLLWGDARKARTKP